jgi:hypothetical protein
VIAIICLACGGSGSPVRRARQPPLIPAGLGRPAIEWLRGSAPTERVLVGEGGIAIGPAGEALARAAFPGPDEADDLRFFAASFAPFSEAAAGERFVFAGRGAAPASAPERRMIREWTRKAAAGATGGAGSAYGLALAWRGGALACDGVSIFLSGEVRAGACDWRQEVRGRLAAEPIARLYRWFDRYRPFQVDALDTGRASAATGVIFAGRGPLEAPAGERLAMSDLAAALHRELAARRTASLAPPPAPPGSQAGPQAIAARRPPSPVPPPPAASGLLRPDLPPPAPATTPITPIAVQPAPTVTDTTAVDRAKTPAAPPPSKARPAENEPTQEEDEAPPQGTEPGGSLAPHHPAQAARDERGDIGEDAGEGPAGRRGEVARAPHGVELLLVLPQPLEVVEVLAVAEDHGAEAAP